MELEAETRRKKASLEAKLRSIGHSPMKAARTRTRAKMDERRQCIREAISALRVRSMEALAELEQEQQEKEGWIDWQREEDHKS